MNGISWLLLILIVLAVVWVIVFKIKNRSEGDCGCSTCHTGGKKTSDCCGSKGEQIIHIQKMGR